MKKLGKCPETSSEQLKRGGIQKSALREGERSRLGKVGF